MKYQIFDTTMLHGGDYNPDQWLSYPEILREDIRLMKLANVNCVSVGIFAWAALEPEEGRYEMDWLEEIISNLYDNGIYTILATPSGARPAWMAAKYPEVLRVDRKLHRNMMGERHNHCYTSPVYRKKVYDLNYRLAQRFKDHPGAIMWHISNEYGGECYCPLCQEEFRSWLRAKYKTLDAVNHAWWNHFWSHTYTDWSQIQPPSPRGETNVHGLNLDWKRFVTDRTVDFCKMEIQAVRDAGSDMPATANLMGFYDGLNYFKFKNVIDVVSWDNYPTWHKDETEFNTAVLSAAAHDLMRSIKKQPFLLMESTPSVVNWQPVAKLKRPGMHMLSSMQAVAHGSNSVLYFQWRKSRGSSEKLHGAVVDHYGKEDTRVFQDVTEVGKRLKKLGALCKTNVKPEVAIVFDWENRWAYRDAAGPNKPNSYYEETVLHHYQAFWKKGIPVDFVDMEDDISSYKLVVAPMLYMYRAGFERKMRDFTANGGILVGTYWSGIVNDTDLCYLGGAPGGGMTDVFGLRSEEIDALYEHDYNEMEWQNKTYRLTRLCDLVIPSDAQSLAVYNHDFYKSRPALTKNSYGKGCAYYLAASAEVDFYTDFYNSLTEELQIKQALKAELPEGVTASLRQGPQDIIILQNYTTKEVEILTTEQIKDFETEEKIDAPITIGPYGVKFITR